MLNQRLSAARRIAGELIPAENDIESAILRTSSLMQSIIEGRRSAKVAINMGQESLVMIAQSMTALVEARGMMARAHQALAHVRVDAGLRAFGMGDVSECPDNPIALHAVGDDRRAVA